VPAPPQKIGQAIHDTTQPPPEGPPLSLFIRLSRLIIGVALLVAGIESISGLPRDWILALRISGSFILFHLFVEASLRLVRRLGSLSGKTEIMNKFTVDTIRQIVNWLITGSGVIIGLLVKTPDLTFLGKASVFSLGFCIVLGFVHISVLAGGVHSENSNQLTLGAVNALYANILLNAMFIFFLLGIVGLSVSLM
jgi:hypothetical protein